ncbi:hypothetical protein H490_0109925 [Leucobacter sp. UCD-THU]|nr:hypothetical protein H490_0109925 [Leucobacter sp. UCD-THU]
MTRDQLCERVDVEPLDVGHERLGAGGPHLVGVVGVADHRRHPVAPSREQGLREKRNLAVSTEENDP